MPSFAHVAQQVMIDLDVPVWYTSIKIGEKTLEAAVPLKPFQSNQEIINEVLAPITSSVDNFSLDLGSVWVTEGISVSGNPALGWPAVDNSYSGNGFDEPYEGVSFLVHPEFEITYQLNGSTKITESRPMDPQTYFSRIFEGDPTPAFCGTVRGSISSSYGLGIHNGLLITSPTERDTFLVYDVDLLRTLDVKVLVRTSNKTTTHQRRIETTYGTKYETTHLSFDQIPAKYAPAFEGVYSFCYSNTTNSDGSPFFRSMDQSVIYPRSENGAMFPLKNVTRNEMFNDFPATKLVAWRGSIIAALPVFGMLDKAVITRTPGINGFPDSSTFRGHIDLWKSVFPDKSSDLDQFTDISLRVYDANVWADYGKVHPLGNHPYEAWKDKLIDDNDSSKGTLGQAVQRVNKRVADRKPLHVFSAAGVKPAKGFRVEYHPFGLLGVYDRDGMDPVKRVFNTLNVLESVPTHSDWIQELERAIEEFEAWTDEIDPEAAVYATKHAAADQAVTMFTFGSSGGKVYDPPSVFGSSLTETFGRATLTFLTSDISHQEDCSILTGEDKDACLRRNLERETGNRDEYLKALNLAKTALAFYDNTFVQSSTAIATHFSIDHLMSYASVDGRQFTTGCFIGLSDILPVDKLFEDHGQYLLSSDENVLTSWAASFNEAGITVTPKLVAKSA